MRKSEGTLPYNETHLSLIFNDEEDAEEFVDVYKDGRGPVEWVDPLGGHSEGVGVLRVERDRGFDQRVRGQVYFHLKQLAVPLLASKAGWSDRMVVESSGPRGVQYCTNGDEIWELFQIKYAHVGGGDEDFVRPNFTSWEQWGCDKDEVNRMVSQALAECTLRSRVDHKN